MKIFEKKQSRYDLVILAHQPRTLRQYRSYAAAARLYLRFLQYARRDPDPQPVGGHYGVTRSLVTGLRALGADFAYAPNLERTSARAAIVLSGLKDLQAAIAWKRRGGCEVLWAGPNVVELPHDQNGILLSPEIDRVVVASTKVRSQYEAIAPSLIDKLVVWPAGVDQNYWKSSGQIRHDRILIYNKRMPELAPRLGSLLQQHGYRCEIINYGDDRKDKYRLYQFRAALDRAYVCVFLSLDEPQGLAASEAWSMDVPTFAFRADGYANTPTIPYLTPATGRYWSSTEELLLLLAEFPTTQFQPRQWVLKNMTDTVCAKQLLAQLFPA